MRQIRVCFGYFSVYEREDKNCGGVRWTNRSDNDVLLSSRTSLSVRIDLHIFGVYISMQRILPASVKKYIAYFVLN